MPDLVITEDREAVRHVVLNRPEKRNAFNEELVLATGAALRAAADDPAVRCVVLRGNGPVFSAGMDVAALAGAASPPERLRSFRRACLEAWNLAEEMTKPVVCAIHGVCLGGAQRGTRGQHELLVERVALLGAVEDDVADRLAILRDDEVGHGG